MTANTSFRDNVGASIRKMAFRCCLTPINYDMSTRESRKTHVNSTVLSKPKN